MVVMAHSSAALFGAPLAARRAGALILLGSYFFPSQDYHASLYEWSRFFTPAPLACLGLDPLAGSLLPSQAHVFVISGRLWHLQACDASWRRAGRSGALCPAGIPCNGVGSLQQ